MLKLLKFHIHIWCFVHSDEVCKAFFIFVFFYYSKAFCQITQDCIVSCFRIVHHLLKILHLVLSFCTSQLQVMPPCLLHQWLWLCDFAFLICIFEIAAHRAQQMFKEKARATMQSKSCHPCSETPTSTSQVRSIPTVVTLPFSLLKSCLSGGR